MAQGQGISSLFYKVVCPGCGACFVSTRRHRRFCGPRCMMRIYRRRGLGLSIPETPAPVLLDGDHGAGINYKDFDKLRQAAK